MPGYRDAVLALSFIATAVWAAAYLILVYMWGIDERHFMQAAPHGDGWIFAALVAIAVLVIMLAGVAAAMRSPLAGVAAAMRSPVGGQRPSYDAVRRTGVRVCGAVALACAVAVFVWAAVVLDGCASYDLCCAVACNTGAGKATCDQTRDEYFVLFVGTCVALAATLAGVVLAFLEVGM